MSESEKSSRVWAALERLGIAVSTLQFGWAVISAIGFMLWSYFDNLPGSVVALIGVGVFTGVLWALIGFRKWRLVNAEFAQDIRLKQIPDSLRRFASEEPTTKAEMQEKARRAVEYVSTALSPKHARRMREIIEPLSETGRGGWKEISHTLSEHLSGIADSLTIADIQPLILQTTGERTDAMHRIDLSIPPQPPLWTFRNPRHSFQIVDGSGSGFDFANKFVGSEHCASDYTCSPPVTQSCQIRFIYRPSSTHTIYVRIGVRGESHAYTDNKYFVVLAGSGSPRLVHGDSEWGVYVPHENLDNGWVSCLLCIDREFRRTFATQSLSFAAIAGLRIRGQIDIASIEFLPPQ